MADAKRYEITVVPKAQYVADQSDPDKNQYVFAYTIRITNTGSVAAQLVSRHWVIIDADQRIQEVKGVGVVGQQPVLKPGETFEYTSGASLATAVGTMKGTYQMLAEDGRPFDALDPAVHAFGSANTALALAVATIVAHVVAFARVPVALFLLALAPACRRERPPDDGKPERQRDQGLEDDPFHRRSVAPAVVARVRIRGAGARFLRDDTAPRQARGDA